MHFVSFVITVSLVSGKCCNGATVATYFCCLDLRIIRRIFAIAAYVSSHIFVRNIHCAARHKRHLKCTWSNTLQARRQTFVRFVNSPPKKYIHENKQTLMLKPKQGNDANNFGPERFSYRQ